MDTAINRSLVAEILAAVPQPMLVVGPDQRLSAVNTTARAIFPEAAEGRHMLTVIRQPAVLEAMETTLRDGTVTRARLVQAGGTGGLQETTWRVTVSALGAGSGRGAVLAFEDITDMEKAEEMRRDFVANVSHELRTPLTALLGFIETLKGAARDDPAARDRFLTIMEREAGRMNRLVRELLQLSRVEAEERVRPGERVDLAALLRSVAQALRPMAEAAGVEIELQGADGAVELLADPDQMTQVFSNLIENAVKYGGAGKVVTVVITREPREIGLRGPAVRFDVIDRGEGIDSIHLPRLTERFYRVDSHRSREKGGTGLGLAIVKHIVNRHRGRLKIDSARGRGSCFTVILPEN